MRLEDSWPSSPVEQFSEMPEPDRRRMEREQMAWMKLPHAAGKTCVQWAKDALGRQHRCWVGGSENRRFYVWEDGEIGWRLFVHNVKGMCFEVQDGSEHDAVICVWDMFKRRAGIK